VNSPSAKANKMVHVRLTPKFLRRVKKCAGYLGDTIMNFTRDGLVSRVEDVERQMEVDVKK
jgi:hypothetical protein